MVLSSVIDQTSIIKKGKYCQISKVFEEAVSKTIVKPKSKSKSKLRVGRTQSKKN